MIVLTTEKVLSQTFNCTPRSTTFNQLTITDESENKTTTVAIIANGDFSYFHAVEAIFNLTENRFYMLELLFNGVRVFYDKVFCTDQAVNTYSVNNGQYNNFTTPNEFIIYE